MATAQVETVVQAAIAAGLYVIVDWWVSTTPPAATPPSIPPSPRRRHEEQAQDHLSEAMTFFSYMAEKYADVPNIIWETFNEPLDQVLLLCVHQHVRIFFDLHRPETTLPQDWSTVIKPYHEHIVSIIREHSDNLIVCGTRTWSQEVDTASYDPVSGNLAYNIAYTVHFYAGVQ